MMIFIDVSVVICWNIKPYRRTLCWTYYTLFVLLERSRLRPASTSGAMLSSRTGFYVLVTLATTLCFWRSSAQTLVETDGVRVGRGNETFLSGSRENTWIRLCSYIRRDDPEFLRLEWLLNGVEYQVGAESIDNLNLAIASFTLNHTGEYSCRARFRNGSIAGPVSAGFIEVIDSTQINVPPRQYVLEGGDITLQCSTTYPNTIITWQFISMASSTGVITDASVEQELAGSYKYKCFLNFNDGAFTTSELTEAVVIVPPQITSHSDTLMTVTPDYTTQHSLSVSFRSRTRDTTNVSWERLDGGLPSHSQIVPTPIGDYGNGTTTLMFGLNLSRSDSGRYRVNVSNSQGVIPEEQRTVSVEMELKVLILPARPNSLAQQSINTTHYRITWKLSHTTPDEEASYLCINLIQPVSTTLPVPLASSEEFILEVEPGYNYELSLIARNEDGDVKTQPISFHTDFAPPLVTSVSIQRLNATSLNVVTDLRYTGGGAITSITLTHDNLSLSLESPRELESKKWGGVVVDNQLINLLEYSSDVMFSVTLSNEEGHQSAVVTAQQTFIPPGPPSELTLVSVSTTSFSVQFQLSTTGTEPLLGVVMEITAHDSNVRTQNDTTVYSRGQVVTMSADGLASGTQYNVAVYGVNAGGRGPSSDPLSVNTDTDNLPIPLEGLIGIVVGGCVVVTLLLIFSIIGFVYCVKYVRNKSGKRYCTADCKEKINVVGAVEIPSKNNMNFSNGYPPRDEGAMTPRSPIVSSRASSTLPPIGTDYSCEESEIDQDSVFYHAPLHKKQSDRVIYNHYQYRHSPAPELPPISVKTERFSNSSSILGGDHEVTSPAHTTLSYATDV